MQNSNDITQKAEALVQQASELAEEINAMNLNIQHGGVDPFVFGLTVFVLACFVGYYVVWKVTPALHTPLMAVTNAISGIIIVGAIIALGPDGGAQDGFNVAHAAGFFAVVLASINIFGGFIVTQRMLAMFQKKEKPKVAPKKEAA
ncbi:MAG: NAD(P) transhydrogenase subunit alpha [Rickettsiales bacterium]|nr:NAD(P) transhydrogenase subunit alpha [Rickettsiales bacterium]